LPICSWTLSAKKTSVFWKEKQPEPAKENEKEKFLKGIRQFEKVIQIVERCIMDETAIDRIARTLGIIVQPETANK
jgi:hypothetical protein